VYQDASRILSRHVTRHTSPRLRDRLRRLSLGTAVARPRALSVERPPDEITEIWLEWGAVHAPVVRPDRADAFRR
jgi:hypothetical protein